MIEEITLKFGFFLSDYMINEGEFITNARSNLGSKAT